ncbi:YceI family protein [Mongoliitalea daihaiensis]|uniref:YceI family protein n=1 Tax=Mongoliitalea daihaiensis TaxID=2782006 RepID=UPI001F1E57E5|nr:YceI family protein [Mongoliitalea daihaiensis]UJP63869.1 YceI family protein [Mongoliitalea daihaiensis]
MKTDKITKLIVASLSLLLFLNFSVLAQTNYTIASGTELKITGGSSLHDWEMISKDAKGSAVFTITGNSINSAQSLKVNAEAESLKSGTRGLDNNAYKALKTSQHKQISFTLKELSGSAPNFTAKGDFTIAGVTKSASFPIKLTQSGNNLVFEGSYDTKLTNFSIDPPTALMGTVKTRDDVTIHFKTIFQPTK